MPYLMGLDTSSLATQVGSEVFSSCVVVHLDKDKIVSPICSRVDGSQMSDFGFARFPAKEVQILLDVLRPHVPKPSGYSNARWQPCTSEAIHSDQDYHENEVEVVFGDGPVG